MFNIIIKNLTTGEYDTPDTTEILHKGDILPINGEWWIVIDGMVLPKRR